MPSLWGCQPDLSDRVRLTDNRAGVFWVAGTRAETTPRGWEEDRKMNTKEGLRLQEQPAKPLEEGSQEKTQNEPRRASNAKGGYTSRPNPRRDGTLAAVGAISFLPKAVAQAEWSARAAR